MNNMINLNGMTGCYNSFINSVKTIEMSKSHLNAAQNTAFGDKDTFISILESNTDVTKAVEPQKLRVTESDFEKMWKTKYPKAKYHILDASKISQGLWERNDFPFEKFFEDNVDESILKWKPSNREPAMADSSVQNRLNSTLGKKSIIVPPELEAKMKNNPKLAQIVMNKVESFIENHPVRPGRICSYLISLNENGDIAHFRATGGGGNISGPSKEEQRRFKEEKERKENKRLANKKILEKKYQQTAIKKHQEYIDFLNGKTTLKASNLSKFNDIFTASVNTRVSEILSAYESGTISDTTLF